MDATERELRTMIITLRNRVNELEERMEIVMDKIYREETEMAGAVYYCYDKVEQVVERITDRQKILSDIWNDKKLAGPDEAEKLLEASDKEHPVELEYMNYWMERR